MKGNKMGERKPVQKEIGYRDEMLQNKKFVNSLTPLRAGNKFERANLLLLKCLHILYS